MAYSSTSSLPFSSVPSSSSSSGRMRHRSYLPIASTRHSASSLSISISSSAHPRLPFSSATPAFSLRCLPSHIASGGGDSSPPVVGADEVKNGEKRSVTADDDMKKAFKKAFVAPFASNLGTVLGNALGWILVVMLSVLLLSVIWAFRCI